MNRITLEPEDYSKGPLGVEKVVEKAFERVSEKFPARSSAGIAQALSL